VHISTLAAAAAGATVPATAPIYFVDDAGTYQPIVRTSYARMRAAFQREFRFTSRLFQSPSTTGKLELKKYDPVARKHVPFKEAKIK
jgi:large subunit ribosomal protein L33